MAELIYTDHLKLRLRIRKIPNNYPEIIYKNPDQKFFDNLEGYNVAIKKLKYNQKLRNMMIVYEEKGKEVEIITIHPITEEKVINRVINKRWTKNE